MKNTNGICVTIKTMMTMILLMMYLMLMMMMIMRMMIKMVLMYHMEMMMMIMTMSMSMMMMHVTILMDNAGLEILELITSNRGCEVLTIKILLAIGFYNVTLQGCFGQPPSIPSFLPRTSKAQEVDINLNTKANFLCTLKDVLVLV